MGLIFVQDVNKFMFFGVPFEKRYSDTTTVDKRLLKKIKQYDDKLDLKFYRPTQMWHLVRYYQGEKFTRVWELDDKPAKGLRKMPGEWILEALKKADTWGKNENIEKEVDDLNIEVFRKVDEEQNLIAADLARELRKPLQQMFDYGANSEFQRYY